MFDCILQAGLQWEERPREMLYATASKNDRVILLIGLNDVDTYNELHNSLKWFTEQLN